MAQEIVPLEAPDILPPGIYYDYQGSDYSRRREEEIKIATKGRPEAYTHQWYSALFDQWEFYRQSYEGGPEFLLKNLWRHPQERRKGYDRRLERAVHLNHIRVVVDTYAASLYRKPWARPIEDLPSVEQRMLEEFWSDADRLGTPIQEFAQRVFRRGLIFGTQAIVVDRWDGDVPEGGFSSLAEQNASGMRPYAFRLDPTDIIDWKQDEKGEFEWVMVREYHSQVREFYQKPTGPEELFRRWTREGWELYRVTEKDPDKHAPDANKEYVYTQLAEGKHPCGKVPIVFAYVGEQVEKLPIAESLIRDLAPLVRQLTNKISLVDEQIFQHVFNILVAPETVYDALQQVDWSVAGVLPMGPGEEKPFYLAPDISQLEAIRTEIRELEMSIRFLSGLGRLNEGSRTYVSGTSLAFQTIDKRALLETLGRSMGEAEREISRLALSWMGMDPTLAPLPGFTVDLEPGEIEKVLTDGLRVIALGIPLDSEAALENMTQAVHAHLAGKISPERLKEVKDDLRVKWEATPKAPPDAAPAQTGSNVFAQVPIQNPAPA